MNELIQASKTVEGVIELQVVLHLLVLLLGSVALDLDLDEFLQDAHLLEFFHLLLQLQGLQLFLLQLALLVADLPVHERHVVLLGVRQVGELVAHRLLLGFHLHLLLLVGRLECLDLFEQLVQLLLQLYVSEVRGGASDALGIVISLGHCVSSLPAE